MQFGPRWMGDSERDDLMVFSLTLLPPTHIMKNLNHQWEQLIRREKDVSNKDESWAFYLDN